MSGDLDRREATIGEETGAEIGIMDIGSELLVLPGIHLNMYILS